MSDLFGFDGGVGEEPCVGQEGVLELEGLFLVQHVAVVEHSGESFEVGVDVGLGKVLLFQS